MSLTVLAVVVTALLFDFTNGFHDTANAMATSIATGALRPRVAVLLSGLLNLIGAFLSVQVAKTIAGGLVQQSKITPVVIFAGLVGAILWNLLSWLLEMPSSSSHALIGGLIGATWVAAGAGAIKFAGLIGVVLVPLVLSPIVAGLIALLCTRILDRIGARAGERHTSSQVVRGAQVLSASAVSLAHGTNDAQKTMGVITLTLITAGLLPVGSVPPLWVIIFCGLAIAAGTASGGWRIIRTLGQRISQIDPRQGFVAQSTSAAVILSSSSLGFPLSTTQVSSGSIFGAGAARSARSVHWDVARQMVLSWLFTLPAAGLIGALAAAVAVTSPSGVVAVAIVGAVLGLGITAAARRHPVDASTVNTLPVARPVPAATSAA